MEHTLHALITILFVYLSAKTISEEKPTLLKSPFLFILAPLLIMTRYEGLFLVFVVSCLFIVKRKPLDALFLSGVGILPIAIYGLVSVSKGWYLLPNSVLLKGNSPDLSSLKGIINSLGYRGYQGIAWTPHLLVLVLGALIIFLFQYSKQKEIGNSMGTIIFIAITFLHTQFARTGGFYRYEAYLVGLGIFVIGISLAEYLPEKFQLEIDKKSIPQYIALVFIGLLLIAPFTSRGINSLRDIPQATTNIYEQQYQMGLFLRKFYQGKAIAANDIGAINYLADIKCLDLWGLGSMEAAKAKMEGQFNGQQIYELAKSENVSIAIIYDHWFSEPGGIPSQWIKIGQWKISNNIVCAGDTVSFYAVDPSKEETLVANLRQFSSQLPQNVTQSGIYKLKSRNDMPTIEGTE